jgi:hypothetical protein
METLVQKYASNEGFALDGENRGAYIPASLAVIYSL